MREIRRLLLLSVATRPEWGTYVHLCRSLRGSGINRRNILKLFNDFMGDEEYDKSEKGELIDYLELQSCEK